MYFACLILEREWKGGEREIGCLPHTLQLGPDIEPAAQACAFDWESNLQPFCTRADALTT